MASLDDVVQAHVDLGPDDQGWLHLLIADWQVLADLSFADLALWLPDRGGGGYWGGAQMRPTTAPTAFVDDLVGAYQARGHRPLIDVAFDEQRIVREGDPEWRKDVPVRVEGIPVVCESRLLGVVTRNTNLLGVRTPSRLELAYLQTADDLAQMISQGRFPYPGQRGMWSASPRVGDGFIRLDREGGVTYASPNAHSAYRRLGLTGDLQGCRLAETTRALVAGYAIGAEAADATPLAVALAGTEPREAEFGTPEVTIAARIMPLSPSGRLAGAAVLVRDVTELRSRERELISKDTTIREIHHRVKNNLQTVAALLRLQSRRVTEESARAGFDEAVRRVSSIALVHETLSHELDEQVDFDSVADRLAAMVADVAGPADRVVNRRHGSFGRLPAEVATPLAMVLTEILQNSVEHGLVDGSGTVELRAVRASGRLTMSVTDDGVGLPPDFDPDSATSLGLSIVRTLVESELGGVIRFGAAQAGTKVEIDLPLRQ